MASVLVFSCGRMREVCAEPVACIPCAFARRVHAELHNSGGIHRWHGTLTSHELVEEEQGAAGDRQPARTCNAMGCVRALRKHWHAPCPAARAGAPCTAGRSACRGGHAAAGPERRCPPLQRSRLRPRRRAACLLMRPLRSCRGAHLPPCEAGRKGGQCGDGATCSIDGATCLHAGTVPSQHCCPSSSQPTPVSTAALQVCNPSGTAIPLPTLNSDQPSPP